jgi:hypothetical protein
MHEASSVTKDFLLLSQPFINQGILIASASAGRRLYIHHLSEVPLNEVFLTRTGNHLQRTDRQTVKLANTITLAVDDIPALPVPSVKMTQAIPTSVFAGPLPGRDDAVLKLLQKGKQANGAGDFSTACACFEAAYALSVRAGMLVSAANMRIKLHQPATAAAMYKYVLSECELLPAEKEMAMRKLAEAQAVLKDKGIDNSPPQSAPGTRRESAEEDNFASFAAFGFEDAGSDAGGSDGKGEAPSVSGEDDFDGDFGDVFNSRPAQSSFGEGISPGGGSAGGFGGDVGGISGDAGGFDADFGDFDEGGEDRFGAGFGSPQAAHPPAQQPTNRSSSGGFPAFAGPPSGATWPTPSQSAPPPPVSRDEDFDFDAPESPAGTSAAGRFESDSFAAFDAPFAPPPQAASAPASAGRAAPDPSPLAPAPKAVAPAAAPAAAPLPPSLPARGSLAAAPATAGGVGGDAAAGLAARCAALEERLRILEQNARAPPAGQAELEQKMERLSEHVNRRLGGVKTGMKGLHERLQAVEVAIARLPEHLSRFKEQQKAQARVGAEHSVTLSRLEHAIPALSAAAAACAGRVGELTRIQQALAEGADPMEMLGASGGVSAQGGYGQGESGQCEAGQGWGGSGGAAPVVAGAATVASAAVGAAMDAGMSHATGRQGASGGGMLSQDDFALFGSAEGSAPPHPLGSGAAGGAPAAAEAEADFGDFAQGAAEVPASSNGVESSAVTVGENGSAFLLHALSDEALPNMKSSLAQASNGPTADAGGSFGDFGDFNQGGSQGGDNSELQASPSAASDADASTEKAAPRLPSADEPASDALPGQAWAEEDGMGALAGSDDAAASGALEQRSSKDGIPGVGSGLSGMVSGLSSMRSGLGGVGSDPEPSPAGDGDAWGAFGGDGGPAGESAPADGIPRRVSDDEFNALFGVEE